MVRVINQQGIAYAPITLAEAHALAKRQHEELVPIAPTARPPIFRLIDREQWNKLRRKK